MRASVEESLRLFVSCDAMLNSCCGNTLRNQLAKRCTKANLKAVALREGSGTLRRRKRGLWHKGILKG